MSSNIKLKLISEVSFEAFDGPIIILENPEILLKLKFFFSN
jgi:hypothetical protein